ncbi:MAG: GNAT family N-acetyltransferase [Bacillus sp. (in: firmicutes)]
MMVIELDQTNSKIAKEILELQTAAYKVEAQIIQYEDLPPLKEDYLSIQTCKETFMGVYSNNRLAAVISFKEEAEYLEICRLVVHPSLFGRGFATKLLDYIIQKKSKRIIVCTAADNKPALQLYIKLGFTIKQIFEVENRLKLVKLEK